MNDETHLEILKKRGIAGWNLWRRQNPNLIPNLRRGSLSDLFGDDSTITIRSKPIKKGQRLKKGHRLDLAGVNLSHADLSNSMLEYAILDEADLTDANLDGANLADARLIGAHLDRAILRDANLRRTKLNGAHLADANLMYAQLNGADLSGADLSRANIYGISAWNVTVSDDTIQSNLRIENHNEASITVPSLEMAQFYYLLKDHKRLRDVISAVIDKGVLLLGRFSDERKAILDAVAAELRKMGYLPIIFDFKKIPGRDLIETIKTLAGLSRFIIADISQPKSVSHESPEIIKDIKIPFVPIIEQGEQPWATFSALSLYPWVIQPYKVYATKGELIGMLRGIVDEANEIHKDLVAKKARSN